jgi:hypothetical protein
MRIAQQYVLEWDGHGWNIRHEPTGLKGYCGVERPSNEKVQQVFGTLQARVADQEKLDDKR